MDNNLINKLKNKTNTNLRVKPIYRDSLEHEFAIKFLKSQKFINYKKIENILKISFLDPEPLGNILINDKEEVVGFLGTIFAKRVIKNETLLHCNLHTWIVEKKYRFQSFRLLIPIIDRNILISTFSPTKSLEGLYEKLGFKKRILASKVLFKFPLILQKNFNLTFYINDKNCEEFLLKKDLKIFKDHLKKNVFNLFFFNSSDKEYVYLVVKKKLKKNFLSVIEILYISNLSNYNKIKKNINFELVKKFKTPFIIINYASDDNYFFFKKAYCLNIPENFNFDLLYSELC
jgi:hypothetical protein